MTRTELRKYVPSAAAALLFTALLAQAPHTPRRAERRQRRANALRTALIDAWREHGIERTPDGQGDGGTVTAQGALQRLCWN